MQTLIRRLAAILGAVALAAVAGASPALAQPKSKTVQSEGQWIAFDPATSTAKVKVTEPAQGGKPPKGLELKGGQEGVFNVKPEGSVLTKTTVKIRGRKAELLDIPAGRTVIVYWQQDEKDPKARFARSIDVILSDAELDEMYPDQE